MTLKIGSHCSMSAPEYFLGSVKEALNYESTALMIYTGAPQNSSRTPLNQLKIEEGKELLAKNAIPLDSVIIHAPYIINLANTVKPETFDGGVQFLKTEIARTRALGAKYLVLHPGSHVSAGIEAGIESIIKGLNLALEENDDIYIALETMAGKGSEVGSNFNELKQIINGVEKSHLLKICMDTCHLNDAGYNISNWDAVLKEFDQIIGLDRLAVIHVNDSKNIQGAHKDRHANFGFGEIGFDSLINVIYHPLTMDVVKILETPYVEGNPPYKEEIAMIRNKRFNPDLVNEIKSK